jgi:hypothetical protein
MNRYKTEDNRQQLSLMPMCLDSKTLFEHRLTNRILGWILLEMW